MKRIVLPEENRKDVPQGVTGIEICFASTIEEAMALVLADGGAVSMASAG